MARAVPECEPKLTRPHLANDELERGGARRLREPVRLARLVQFYIQGHVRAPCRARTGRAPLPAGTWPRNSTVKTPSNNTGVSEGPVEAPHVVSPTARIRCGRSGPSWHGPAETSPAP